MCAYRRAKREDCNKSSKKEMSMSVGTVEDSSETLERLCNDKSIELLKTVELSEGEEMDVVFWTGGYIPELICRSIFKKNESGLLSYSLDFSECTL